MSNKSRIIGIDLGTTNSCVSIMEGKDPIVIPNSEGSRTTPSIVAFTESGERLIGQVAKRQAVTNPERTIYSVKRLMGRKFDSEETKRQREMCPYKIVSADNMDSWVEVGGKEYSPPEISASILLKMKEVVRNYIGEDVDKAVVTVPAYFNDAQRQATKDAGLIAGLKVERIINEPTAAALAYGYQTQNEQKKILAVYDLGGGTFDISIMEIDEGVFAVKATSGNTFLGGEDFDQKLVDYFAEKFFDENKIDLRKDKMALQRLKESAEKVKHELSSALETEVNLPFIAADDSGPKHLAMTVRRDEFENLVEDIIEETFNSCKQAIGDAGLKLDEIDDVLLVGGMTRMPLVQKKVEEFFNKPPLRGVNPDEVVATGAAIQGYSLSGKSDDILLLDVTPLSLGVETGGGIFTVLIERNTTIPTRKQEIFTTSVDNQTSVPVHVLQGERQMSKDNTTLARFDLYNIPPAPRQVPKIRVTFDINADGIVTVLAQDMGTGREQSMEVTAGSGLSERDIERIISEAEAQKETDDQNRALAEARIAAETIIYSTEQAMNTYSETVAEEDITVVTKDISELKEALEVDDLEAIELLKSQLESSAFRIAEAMYAGLEDE